MPHKHKRRKLDDGATFDLPPTAIAKALPAFQKQRTKANGAWDHTNSESKPVKSKNKAKLNPLVDDTPKSFARLMQFHTLGKRLPKGLDDGSTERAKTNRKRKLDTASTLAAVSEAAAPPPTQTTETHPIPKIQPGERLSDFAARVDQAIPIAGLRSTDKQRALKVPGLKERTTKHNKRLERMQQEWREGERRRKEKREEEMDELEEEREEHSLLWSGEGGTKKKRTKKGRKGPAGDEDDDPWKALEKSRAETKQRNLQDVVQAPPQLKKVPSKFKLVGGGGGGGGGGSSSSRGGVGVDVGNVPGRVGSLRQREKMGEARRKVIEGYRKRMGRA